MVRHRVGWPIVVFFLCCVCARNPQSGLLEDGRLYLWLDLPSNRVSTGYLEVHVEAEGFEPVNLKLFDFEAFQNSSAAVSLDVSDAIDWYEAANPQCPLLLLDDVIKGGSEVHVRVAQRQFDFATISFNLDGDTSLRVYVERPEEAGAKHLWIERSSRGSLF